MPTESTAHILIVDVWPYTNHPPPWPSVFSAAEGEARGQRKTGASWFERVGEVVPALQAGPGSQLLPVTFRIALVPLEQIETPQFGVITSETEAYTPYCEIRDHAIVSDFCRLHA